MNMLRAPCAPGGERALPPPPLRSRSCAVAPTPPVAAASVSRRAALLTTVAAPLVALGRGAPPPPPPVALAPAAAAVAFDAAATRYAQFLAMVRAGAVASVAAARDERGAPSLDATAADGTRFRIALPASPPGGATGGGLDLLGQLQASGVAVSGVVREGGLVRLVV